MGGVASALGQDALHHRAGAAVHGLLTLEDEGEVVVGPGDVVVLDDLLDHVPDAGVGYGM